MKYEKSKYIGKEIQFSFEDKDLLEGEIIDVDDLGWTIKITGIYSCMKSYSRHQILFVSHSKPFIYTIKKEK